MSAVVHGTVILRLPVPPSTNHIYRRNEWGGTVLKDSVKAFRQEVADCLLEQWPGQGSMPQPPYRVTVDLFLTSKRKRDLDNSLKSILDSLAKCLGFDDNDVTEIHATKTRRESHPCCVVTIEHRPTQAGG